MTAHINDIQFICRVNSNLLLQMVRGFLSEHAQLIALSYLFHFLPEKELLIEQKSF